MKNSLGRFMAIFAIIALGVGFFTGLKATKPDMIRTARNYLEEQKFYDYRLISTWGFTEEEIEDIQGMDHVTVAEGAVWEDFLYLDGEGEERCMKALSITEDVNNLTLKAGRLPETAQECVVDAYHFGENMIGQEIYISQDNTDDTKDYFVYDSYTVTGLVRTPLYINMERGTTSIGNGKISSFVFLPLEGFSYEYYKEVYVLSDVEGQSFTQEYIDGLEERVDGIEENVEIITAGRYETEIADAQKEIDDGWRELEEETEKARRKLSDAEEELLDGEQQLADGKQELLDGERQLAEKEQELLDGERALEEGEQEYRQGLSDYDAGLSQYQQQEALYQQNLSLYESGVAQLEQGRESYQQAKQQQAQLEAAMPAEMLAQSQEYQALCQGIASFEATEQELANAQAELAQGKALLDSGRAELENARMQLETAAAEIESNRQLLADGRRQIAEARTELANARQEISENEEKLQDGWEEYRDGLRELEEEIAEAEAELKDGQKELDEVEKPKLYVLDRSLNVGYACYDGDVTIVESVAKIFPIFFFLIAALVCSTTMTRMVDDDRTQIGTLRALGYGNGAILGKYVIYSGCAAGLGCAAGYVVGVRLFPTAIWSAYNMLYGFSDLTIYNDLGLFLASLVASLVCSVGTTAAACRMELIHTPADLIRPKAPAAGKRILLERVGIIWKRLKFLHKVSARNVFRFKKRMIMMILGISGCTALVLTGFGIKDSVSNIVNFQYDEIFIYDISATYSKAVTDETVTEIQGEFGSEIERSVRLLETSVEAPFEGGSKSVTLLVSEGDGISQCVDFHFGGDSVALPGEDELIVDNRLAEALNLEIGDEIVLKSGDDTIEPLLVAGIFENYTYYYAYMNAATYERYFEESYEPTALYFRQNEGADPYEMSRYLSNMDDATNVNVIEDMRIRVGNIMKNMNFVVGVVICSAAALAFIVLFNLGNINISERVREIATLKVLGFYSRETGSYVFRESMVLSLMGIVVGLPLGVLLHRFVMSQLKIDMVSFQVSIFTISYLYTVVAVVGFTVCVDLMMRRKINRINMAESLKSIE